MAAALVLIPANGTAQEAEPARSPATFTFRTSIKAGALFFRAPAAPALFPDRTGAESLWRVRFEPVVTTGDGTVFTLGYEQRLRYRSSGGGIATAGILPSQGVAPFRVRQLDWGLSDTSTTTWRHEIDRANVRMRVRTTEFTIGRQAIGWGRGVIFGAVDLFAPFAPLEADREWRRGVDAIRADVKLTDRSSLDIVGAFGPAWDRSAVAARVRGYAGPMDVEVMAGRRARDVFGGLTTSAAVGDAELHGEVAAFRVPADLPRDDSHLVWKAVAGGSYRIPIGSGVLFYVEYHYSGFGAQRPSDILPMLSTPAFAGRYLRGDTQILSRHAVGLIASYEASTELSLSGQWIHNPRDRSGVLAPGFTWTFSDRMSVLGTVYGPYGRAPQGAVMRSEYGTASRSGLLQLRVYL